MPAAYVGLGASGPQEVPFLVTSAGAADAGKGIGLDATGRLDTSLMPVGISADTYTGNAFEALAAGAFVYIKADGTVANASAASGGVGACGFVLAGVSSGASATVYFEGRNTAKTGLTVGTTYFLSDTIAGGTMTTPPSGTGKLYQVVGSAITPSSINTEMSLPVIRA